MDTVTEALRRQHREILACLDGIEPPMTGGVTFKKAVVFLRGLRELSELLGEHLAKEDHILYPRLLVDEDEEIRALAREFSDEMGPLGELFNGYLLRWNMKEIISVETDAFVSEMGEVFAALRKRIDREENILFPKVEALARRRRGEGG